MVKNNKGFTMVELVVSIAIFAILSIGITNFMVTGTNLFASVNTYVDLQYESQTAMAQLQEYVIDSNYSVNWDDTADTLTIVNHIDGYGSDGIPGTGDDTITVVTHVFRLNVADEELLYGTATHDVADATPTIDPQAIMARHVTGFDVTRGAIETVTAEESETGVEYNVFDNITFTLTLENHGREYETTQDLFLRNKPEALF